MGSGGAVWGGVGHCGAVRGEFNNAGPAPAVFWRPCWWLEAIPSAHKGRRRSSHSHSVQRR